MTGLPFETIRRQVKAMQVSGLIKESEPYSLLINKDAEFHQKCAVELVYCEQKEVIKLIEKAIHD